MADNLDVDQAIAMVDEETKEIKATPYFEDYLFKIITTLGGEGSTIIEDLVTITIESDKIDYMFGLVKALRKQVDEINNTIDSPILDAKVKTMQTKLGELEAHFDTHQILSSVKQLQADTAGFVNLVKTANYTAENKNWVEARSGITIDLPANAVSGDEVIVSNGDGTSITIDGNGNNIKYTSTDTTIVISRQGSSLSFGYFVDNVTGDAYWRAR